MLRTPAPPIPCIAQPNRRYSRGRQEAERSRGVATQPDSCGQVPAERDVRLVAAEGHQAEGLSALRGELDFHIGRSRRYSAKLAKHFAALDRASTFLALLSGSSAIAALLYGLPTVNVVATCVVVAASLSSIAFRWGEEARHFTEQYRAYTDLAVRFARLGRDMSVDQYREMTADYLKIEALERSPLLVLNAICHNEECGSRDRPDGCVTVRWWQRWAAKWIDLPPTPGKAPSGD